MNINEEQLKQLIKAKVEEAIRAQAPAAGGKGIFSDKIGRASCRERV